MGASLTIPDVTCYPLPAGMPVCDEFALEIGGRPTPLCQVGVAAFATCALAGAAEVTLTCRQPVGRASVSPWRLGIATEVSGNAVSFRLPRAVPVAIQVDDRQPVYLFVSSPDPRRPDPGDPHVHYFAAGRVHDVGVLEVGSGETVYVEGGAVVRGAIHAADAQHVAIRGHGILDGGCFTKDVDSRHGIQFEACRGVTVEDITMVRPSSWMLVLGDCEEVTVRGIKQLGECVSSDGIDVVGSRHVRIAECFLRNNDDCVVVKALDPRPSGAGTRDWRRDVHDIRVERCTLYNDHAGNAMEVGFELCAERVHDVHFRDIDVIGAHGEGAVFSIHNGDGACVENVTWEQIRIEHFYSKFVDFRVLDSRYSREGGRGSVRNVRVRDVQAIADIFNTPSLIGGWDADHTVEGVRFENVRLAEKTIRTADDLHLFLNDHAHGIAFG